MRHKYYVFLACRRVGGIPIWRALFHDWSKFLPGEYIPYAQWFYGGKKNRAEWEAALLHHKNRNPHHFEYWISRQELGVRGTQALPMPETYLRELVADWMGAQQAYNKGSTGDYRMWYEKNRQAIRFHPDTEKRFLEITAELFE
jgi:hypothetical protein